jgi:NAD(P)-dependent dehydrogenase (short-subunit alcohol dehydrogenase family)
MCSDLQTQARPNVSQDSTIATHELIVQQSGKAKFVKTDVTNEAEVVALITETVKEFGRLDM